MKAKKTTTKVTTVSLDDLASMVVGGFKEQKEHFDTRIDGVEARIDGLESRFDGLESRFNGVEQKLGALHSDVLSMHYDHKLLKARMENVELRVFGSIQGA